MEQELWGQEGDSRLQSLLLSTYKVRRRVLKARIYPECTVLFIYLFFILLVPVKYLSNF